MVCHVPGNSHSVSIECCRNVSLEEPATTDDLTHVPDNVGPMKTVVSDKQPSAHLSLTSSISDCRK